MPTLYGANASPFVRKVRVALAEKKVPYDQEPLVPFNVSPEYRKISPLGKIPAWRDGNVTLADSSVICAYLERTHPEPRLYPAEPYEYARALWFEEWADGGFVTVVGPKIFFRKIVAPLFLKQPVDEAAIAKAVDEDLPPYLDYLEGEVREGKPLVGNAFSIADIGVGTQFVNLHHAGVRTDARRWPKTARWVEQTLARPSFRALVEEEEQSFRPR
jgi:glutathione S-transferase